MDLKDLIIEIKNRGIEIGFSNGKLKYIGPEENITPEIIEELKKNKGKLIKYFWPKELALMMPINTEGSKTPLFIVHGDYANYAISEHLGKDQPVYGFFHPGSEGEVIPYKSTREMAKKYMEQVKAVFPSGPFYLMGFSFGGTLAFEMAVQLQKEGYKIPVLILLDSFSPLAMGHFKWYSNIFLTVKRNYLRPVRRKLKRSIKQLINNSYSWRNKPVPLDRRAEYIANTYAVLTEKYLPEKFEGNVLLFKTDKNTSSFDYLGWETLANKIKLVNIKGGHLDIFSNAKNTEIVQREIQDLIAFVNGLE